MTTTDTAGPLRQQLAYYRARDGRTPPKLLPTILDGKSKICFHLSVEKGFPEESAEPARAQVRSDRMRIAFLFSLFVAGTVWANPSVGPPPLQAYLESEKLLVTLTPTDATYTATFTFRSVEANQTWHGSPRWAIVSLPIWFPEDGSADPVVERFWKVFKKDSHNLLLYNPVATRVFDETIGLRVYIGQNQRLAGSDIPEFYAAPGYAGASAPDPRFKNEKARQYVETILAKSNVKLPPEKTAPHEPGFYCLLTEFGDAGFVQHQTPVKVSYHHPLVRTNGEGVFYYLPIFDNLPKNLSTTNVNWYAITLIAKDCRVTATMGDRKVVIENGYKFTFAPAPQQPIRARTTPIPARPAVAVKE